MTKKTATPWHEKSSVFEKLEADETSVLGSTLLQFETTFVQCGLKNEKEIRKAKKTEVGLVEEFKFAQRKLSSEQKTLEMEIAHQTNVMSALRQKFEEVNKSIKALEDDFLALKIKNDVRTKEVKEKQKMAKEVFDAHVLANNYFKKKLPCYIDFQDGDMDVCTFHFFVSDRNAPRNNYFVKLLYKDSEWELLTMVPQLPYFELLQDRLKKTNDIPGFIACVHKLFTKLKNGSDDK